MDWEIVSATGEWAGAIAVVVTLFYVARQIRDGTSATRANVSASLNDSLSRIVGALRSDKEFADTWLRGCRDINSLDEVEQVRFTSHILDMLNLAEHFFLLEKQDLSRTHINYIPWIALLYRENPGYRDFVDSLKDGYAGSPELYARITDIHSAHGTNLYAQRGKETETV
jgi:hypothetical protein